MKILRTRRTLPQLRGAALSALMLTATMGTMAGPGAQITTSTRPASETLTTNPSACWIGSHAAIEA